MPDTNYSPVQLTSKFLSWNIPGGAQKILNAVDISEITYAGQTNERAYKQARTILDRLSDLAYIRIQQQSIHVTTNLLPAYITPSKGPCVGTQCMHFFRSQLFHVDTYSC